MSFGLDGSEQAAAQNLGSLEGYLGDRQYTTSQLAMNGEQVVRDDGGAGYAPPPAYAPQGTAVQSGVSREQFEAMAAYAQRMEQTAQVAAQQALIQEEHNFLAQLDYAVEMGQITEAQRDVQIVLRRNDQLERSHMTMAQRIQMEEDEAEERDQMEAKVQVSFREAMNHGINWFNNDIRNTILKAETLEEMRSNLRTLQLYPGALLPPNGAPPMNSSQIQNGAFAAASGRGTANAGANARKHTGDLGSYIKSKGGYRSMTYE